MIVAASALLAFGALAAAPSAFAHSGEYAEFNNCPSTNTAVAFCLHTTTNSGEVLLGKKRVPIVKPVVLQGGISEAGEDSFAKFYGATNGETLTKAAQPVPGGLSGLVNCKEISNFILRGLCEVTFENGLTGVNATLELAKPASEIKVSLLNLLFAEGTAVVLPVKVHLENPLLGSGCYIGSSSSPILWNLTTGTSGSLVGAVGTQENVGGDEGILRLNGNKLVDNKWAAPGANGCGGILWEWALDPIIEASVGVPSKAGTNKAVLTGVADESPVEYVNKH